uniref:Sacsin n=1 Tax=Leptobrachium leishanense TaxID=445787 RepID=A0A8C5PJB0_9ANUR
MDFFQRAPPFLIQLQTILRKYPDGGQILKELLQNADDAKASEVIFIYDETQYGTETLYSKDLQNIQGPALLAYNNEMFTDRDWEGIQKPGNSIKRKNPNTVGKFGLGFNSVYHITDHPTILSGRNIGILDPQETVFHRGGLSWNFEKDKKSIEELVDQFHPFQTVLEVLNQGFWSEVLKSGCFKGTLFRFPFRLTPSEISEHVYNSLRVQELFESFTKDACISLLFLRHVTTVSLKKIDRDGEVINLLTVNADSVSSVETVKGELDTGTHLKVTTVKHFERQEKEFIWLLTTCLGHGNLFPHLEELSKKLYNNIALDLAFPLTKEGVDSFGGRLSCALPLPDKAENRTGLPVVINGCFDLTDDRRSIKWIEVDQQHDDAAKWNHILIEKLLPIVYTFAVMNAIFSAKVSSITIEEAYGIWPDPDKTKHNLKWHNLTKELSKSLANEKVLQTADNSCWVSASEAIFLFNNDDCVLSCLENLLLMLKKPLVKIPGNVYRTLTCSHKPLNIVSPPFIRKILQTSDWTAFPNEKKLLLLSYVMSDGQYDDLINLPLLPLSDGSFITFQRTAANDMAYIDVQSFPRTLLPGLVKRFVPQDLPGDILCHLRNIGLKRSKAIRRWLESKVLSPLLWIGTTLTVFQSLGICKNIECLDEAVVCKRLSEALPETWLGCEDSVRWLPGEPNNPPIEWLSEFWTFLRRYDGILVSVESQPIVPLNLITENSTEIQLTRLKRNTTSVFQRKDGYVLNDCLVALLKQAGCSIVQENTWLWHKNLLKYILVASPNNILQIFCNLNLNKLLKVFAQLPQEQTKMFCNYISQASSFTAQEISILNQLPIFCSTKNIQFSDARRLVTACGLRALDRNTIPAVPEDLVFPSTFITCRDESDSRLLQLMKITLLKASDVALQFVQAMQMDLYGHYQNEAQNVMLWILRNGLTIFVQNEEVKHICKNLNFIPHNGKMTKASGFFDPSIQTFHELFEADKFPPSSYQEYLVLMSLRTLGLKCSIEDITSDDVLEISEKVGQLKCHMSAKKKAMALINVCNTTNVLSKLKKTDLKKLCSTSWVPFKVDKIHVVFYEPRKLRNMKYSAILELSMPLTNDFNEQASRILGLSDIPPPDKVVENLKKLSQITIQIDKFSFHKKLHDIYKYIQDHIEQFDTGLLNVPIWNGENFSAPDKIVLFYPDGLDLVSYKCKVPNDLLIYKSLFLKCGVQNSLSEDEVIRILHILNQNINTRTPPSGTDKELKLTISILDWMRTNSVHSSDDLPIPVQANKCGFCLKPLSTTLFCDIDKIHINDLSSKDYNIIHEEVSPATVRFLNIPLLSTKILQPEYFEPWGPSEPITLRIKNILREYSEHVDLFKEILQNADDAESTVCEFLVDMRQNLNSQQSLIDPDMALCHGPALWCYNNSKFTENDFRNITHIGAATKETKIKKIGKFGLGFNTVYRITDIPSIMSGSKLLIFDPNINHIKKHIFDVSNPGIKLDLQKNPEAIEIFADQFQPFSKVFGCEIEHPFHFEGTLIRLPFRTKEEAKISQICEQVCSDENITVLLDSLKDTADVLLIFLKNVDRVSLTYLHDGLHPEEQMTKLEIQRLKIPEGIFPKQKLIHSSNVPGLNTDFDITESNIIKLTVQQSLTSKDRYYLLQSSVGIQKSMKMFSESPKAKFSLPVAGVAFPLKKNHETGKWIPDLLEFNGVVFCFLPLPISSGLPFHLNGSFSVMSNRKGLWSTTEKGEWNKNLFGDACLVALISALSQLQELRRNGMMEDYDYHTFWPDLAKVKSQFTEVVTAFYQAVTFGFADYLPPLFSNGHESCTIKHACYLQLEGTTSETKVFSQLISKPYLAVPLPEWVENGFNKSNCSTEVHRNCFNSERFYKELIFEKLDSLSTEARNALILHAVDMQSKPVDKLLLSKPCIPSSPHGKLQHISKLVHPEGKVSILYNQQDQCFPQGDDFLKPDRLARLHFLGMAKDKLSMNELMQRALTISDVWKQDSDAGLQKIYCVLELLNDLCQHSKDNISQAEFRGIPFLPAFVPQNEFDVKQNSVLMKSSDVYHFKHKDLICMIKPVLSKEHLGKTFTVPCATLSFLGLDQPPTLDLVILQLQKIHKMSNMLNTYDVSQMVRSCYTFLNKLFKKGSMQATNIRKKISNIPLIYVDQDFVSRDFVAHRIPFDGSPYLYALPKEYEAFRNLWDCVELREEFPIEEYISVLQKMAVKYKEKPLPEIETKLALNIISHCSKIQEDSKNSVDLYTQKMFILDQQCVLYHRDKIYFNDTPWLPIDTDLHFCHKLIPRAVAVNLGIKTKIHHTLQKLKVSNLSHWVSQFGAKEELTTRIKNIINEYSSKKDILKELIQNADDSNATEIHFVLDSRKHETQSTFGPSWNPLQGPALCVYNNKTFDSTDIEGIQMLGKGSKRDRLDKTGKFGLGFNTVYHITDCPSFVTEDFFLCVFDPNLTFLPDAEINSPGGMYKLDQEFKNTFKNVYDTFLPTSFNLHEGTVFRLPLRMANTVATSKISNETVSLDDIRELCKGLEEDASSMVLFLNHIRKITFSEILSTGEVKEMLSIRSEIEPSDQDNLSAFQQKLSHFAINDRSMFDTQTLHVVYKMNIVCNSKKPLLWLVAKQVGIEEDHMLDDLHRISKNLNQSVAPQGAVAACLKECVEGRAFCTLPLPVKTGLPVHISGIFVVDAARRDICKEDGSSSKKEWNLLLISYLIAPLYVKLLECIKKNMISGRENPLFFSRYASCKCFLDAFLSYLPNHTNEVSPTWQILVKKVYRILFEKQVKLVPVYKIQTVQEKFVKQDHVLVKWSYIGHRVITKEPYFLKGGKSEYEKLGSILHSINMNLAYDQAPRSICKEFKAAGVDILELTPETLCNFLRLVSLHSQGKKLPMNVNETLLKEEKNCLVLLKYCCIEEDYKPRKNIDLQGVPLFVTEDGMLQTIDRNNPRYHSAFSMLLPVYSHLFVKCEVSCIETLEKCGFLKPFTIQDAAVLIKQQLGPSYQISSDMDEARPIVLEIEIWLNKLWCFFESKVLYKSKEKQNEQFEEILSIFKDWAILPVCYGKLTEKPELMPLSKITITLFSPDEIAECLFKLGFPKLKSTLIPTALLTGCMYSHLLNTKDVCVVVEQLHSKHDLHWNKLDAEFDTDRLLRFFLIDLNKHKNKALMGKLQSLPLFETNQGKRKCLNIYQKKYILNAVHHLESTSLCDLDPKTIFLKNNTINVELSKYIAIKIISEVEFLVEFLLSNLASLREEIFLHVLTLILEISHLTEYEKNKATVISALKPLKLIRDKAGTLQQISHFYDDTVKIFRTFELHSMFIPDNVMKQFKKYGGFHGLLRDLGLRCVLSEIDFLAFATKIEKDAKNTYDLSSLETLMSRSDKLFDYLLSMDEKDLNDDFTSKFGNIKFLFPLDVHKDLKSLFPSHSESSITIELKGSLLKQTESYESLTWTSMHLIQKNRYFGKKQLHILEKCGVLIEPPVNLVVENLKNVCMAPCEHMKSKMTRHQVLKLAYCFLQCNTSFDPKTFDDVQCILVENDDLTEPGNVVFNLVKEDRFRPFLFKLPPFLACYSELFQKIGVVAEPTISHYVKVLSTIYKITVQKNELHPNLKRTTLAATKKLFHLLEKEKPSELPNINTLYLPATDGKLYDSSSLVLNNRCSTMAKNRLSRIFTFLAFDQVQPDFYKREKLVKCLPEQMRPKMLTQITKEVVDSTSEELCKYGENCPLQRHLQEILASPIFHQCLVCLLRFQSNGKLGEDVAFKICSNIFGRLEIICCSTLMTTLIYDHEPLDGALTHRDVFVNRKDGTQIYLHHVEHGITSYLAVFTRLAIEIISLMEYEFNSQSFAILLQMLSCENSNELLNVLKKNDIWIKNMECQNAYGLPNPGEPVPAEWYDALDMSILNSFKVNDYVGYMNPSEEGTYYYVVVVDELDSKKFENCEIKMYRICLGQDEFADVSVLDLYQFKSDLVQDGRELELVEDQSQKQDISEKWYAASLEDTKREIDVCLESIWQLPKDERIKAVRRLHLKYHPDKNIGQEERSTEICKYLQQRIRELDNCATSSSASSSYHPNPSSSFYKYWTRWDGEASNHRTNHESFSNRTKCSYNFWGYHKRSNKPNPEEARRWLKQAEIDLSAAECDVGHQHTEWVFFKVHQAVEKSLYAAQYLRHGKTDMKNNLGIGCLAGRVSAYCVSLQSVSKDVLQLERYGVDKCKTQYPNYHNPPGIPNDCMPTGQEQKVIKLAADIVQKIKIYIC